MPDVGDRVEMLSKSGTRQGQVTRMSGAMLTVEWDSGGQTTVIPAPGVMRVIGAGARKRPAAKKTAAAKKAPAKKPTAKKTPVKKKAAPAKKKKAPAKKAAAKKKAKKGR